MKASPYFAPKLIYFFFRFFKEESLFKWFLKKASQESEAFVYPSTLSTSEKTILFLPHDIESTKLILSALAPILKTSNFLLVCSTPQVKIIQTFRLKTPFLTYTESENRYGENAFFRLESEIIAFNASVVLYLENTAFLPRLYLAKKSGAKYRIGFFSETSYPFLNISLKPKDNSILSKIDLLLKQYQD